ncbi:MAG: PilZ domain-containing protein [Acidobacteriota bacterium]
MDSDKRKHPRTTAGSRVRYRSSPSRHATAQYCEGLLENVSLGGVFITAEQPLPEGDLVELELQSGFGDEPILATAVVRWNRTRFQPRGMGLQFVEFEGRGKEQLEAWIQGLLSR